MAFCKYCGKELKDGEACSCSEAVAAAQAAAQPQAESAPQAADGAVPSLDTEKILSEAKEIGKSFLGVFTKPATKGREFVANAKLSASFTMIIVQALLSSIFSLFVVGAINGALKRTWFASYSLSGLKTFFLTLLFSLAGSAILAACFCLAAMITRVKVLWRQLAALTAVRSVAVMPLIAVSCIVWLIKPALGLLMFYGSALLAMAFLLEAVKGIEGMKDNKALWTVFVVMIVFFIITVVLFSACANLYLPAKLRENLDGIGSVLDLLI